ncbi:uncharacterized protein LY89DRAFT_488424 [Mollisia scopiformis]|uniref:Uncharacterized protein n=1 Tax=Mollisia scopiformis TaxID=149040 RepID=A0A194XGM2_MOLSC|nr:uncharacterized protein LY89DRAFT_488424 [Mollisia scopiformis]KUJ19318.1 hypothetical protein LY89DRAFT_488424 [Mollisia scopiformis]
MQIPGFALFSLAATAVALPSNLVARSNYNLQTCVDLNLEGNCVEMNGAYNTCTDVPTSFNDVISSIAGDQRTSCRAYMDAGCNGDSFVVPKGVQLMRIPETFNDQISSFWC